MSWNMKVDPTDDVEVFTGSSGLQTSGRSGGRCSCDSRRVPAPKTRDVDPSRCPLRGGRGFKQYKLLRKAVQFTFLFCFVLKKKKKGKKSASVVLESSVFVFLHHQTLWTNKNRKKTKQNKKTLKCTEVMLL